MDNKFASQGPQDLSDLVAGHPLAWLVSTGSTGLHATPLPLLLKHDAQGRLTAVEGHFARSNPQVEALRQNPSAHLLWMGVQGYVSPSWMADRTQAPTWNYASAQCAVRVGFVDDAAFLLGHLRELVGRFEADRPNAWSVDEMGARLHQLAQRVIGFRAEVVDEVQQRFKLGQDERDDVFADILGGLDEEPGAAPLTTWMRRFNATRA